MKKPKRKKDWVGLRVRSRKDLRNALGKIPAGTIFTVNRNYAGLQLESDPCPHCGVRFFITKVSERDVTIIEEEEDVSESDIGRSA